jgi:hypothetical protein
MGIALIILAAILFYVVLPILIAELITAPSEPSPEQKAIRDYNKIKADFELQQ